MPRKTFTAGEVLAAADVNTLLMDQSVMTFADSAARGSAIGTATEGMVTYLEDSNLYSGYDGTSFTSLAELSGSGLVHIASFSASGVTSVDINGCFSTKFDNYLLVVRGTTVSNTGLEWRLRNSGTTDSSANYDSQFLEVLSTTVQGIRVTAQTSGSFGSFRNTETAVSATIFSPFATRRTMAVSQVINPFGDITYSAVASKHRLDASYDSLVLLSGSNINITGSIHGYTK
jgi:hypothetical protein